jgi:hypothetical protein
MVAPWLRCYFCSCQGIVECLKGHNATHVNGNVDIVKQGCKRAFSYRHWNVLALEPCTLYLILWLPLSIFNIFRAPHSVQHCTAVHKQGNLVSSVDGC